MAWDDGLLTAPKPGSVSGNYKGSGHSPWVTTRTRAHGKWNFTFDLKTPMGRFNSFMLLMLIATGTVSVLANWNQNDWWRDLVGFSPYSQD